MFIRLNMPIFRDTNVPKAFSQVKQNHKVQTKHKEVK